MVDLVIVDDHDPRIQYAGVWEESGTSSELNGTTHGVRGLENEVVGNATFTFTGEKEIKGKTFLHCKGC